VRGCEGGTRHANASELHCHLRLWLWWAMCVWRQATWVRKWHSSRKRQPTTLAMLPCNQLLSKLSWVCSCHGLLLGRALCIHQFDVQTATPSTQGLRFSLSMLSTQGSKCLTSQRRGHWVKCGQCVIMAQQHKSMQSKRDGARVAGDWQEHSTGDALNRQIISCCQTATTVSNQLDRQHSSEQHRLAVQGSG
jgi:hypothetical protein